MVTDCIDITTLNLGELSGVVSLYPWYAGARMELCRRMAALGEEAWDSSKYADHALYIPSRRLVFAQMEKSRKAREAALEQAESAQKPKPTRQVFVIGGDYYSQEDYDSVRRDDDNIFASFAGKAGKGTVQSEYHDDFTDFCTEFLAKVYLEQGYPEKAKYIYSKLSLVYPEKSVYFASLIEKTEQKI